MPLKLEGVTSAQDFTDVGACMQESFSDPPNAYFEASRSDSVDEVTKRFWSWHQSESDSRWIKVTDTETGDLLGAAEWIVHSKERPYDPLPPIPEATWHLEGSPKRDIASQFVNVFLSERFRRMNQPHLLLNVLFTTSEARRRGVGRLLMAYGTKLADELGLDTFIESSAIGQFLYRACGFESAWRVVLKAENPNPDAEWTAVYEKWKALGLEFDVMWRPKGGKAGAQVLNGVAE